MTYLTGPWRYLQPLGWVGSPSRGLLANHGDDKGMDLVTTEHWLSLAAVT